MYELPIRTGDDVVRVRQQVRVMAAKSGLSLVDQTKVVTAASELARNALIHGGGGTARLEVVTSPVGRTGVRIGFTDEGPGIPDLDLALTDGWTTGAGLGLGLSGARRLVDEFELASKPGGGTSVVVVKWSRLTARPGLRRRGTCAG
jgi:serine/threonine-protein kinase RsbT